MIQTGTLSPNTIEKKFITAGQSSIGMVQRYEARVIARYSVLKINT